MNVFSLSGISVGISCIILSLLVLFFGKTTLHRLLFLFNITVAVWGFGVFFVGNAAGPEEALFGWKFANSAGFFIGPVFYHMTTVLCGIDRKKIILFAYLQAFIFLLINIKSDVLINTVRPVFGLHYNVPNPFYMAAVVFYFLFVILSYYELLKYLPSTQGRKRTQMLYIIFGFMVGFIGGSSSFLPMFNLDIVYPFGNFGITVYCTVVTYAILRRNLMDIHIIFKRTMAYSLSAGLLTGFFIVLVLSVTHFFSGISGMSSFKISIIAALIIAILFTPLKDNIQVLLDKLFFRDPYDYYAVIRSASHEFASSIDLEHIQRYIVDTIFSALQLKTAYILSGDDKYFRVIYSRTLNKDDEDTKKAIYGRRVDPESGLVKFQEMKREAVFREEFRTNLDRKVSDAAMKEFDIFKCEVAVPIFIEGKTAFLLLLGEKKTGDVYSAEDVTLLNTIAGQAAVSLKNALLYEELKLKILQLEQADSQIRSSLKEKEVLLREIHHRVKNNMQVILSLLNMQSRCINDDLLVDILRESRDRIKSMAIVHEKLYMNEKLTNVDFNDYIMSVAHSLFSSYRVAQERISFETDVKNIMLPIDTAIPCGLIINELLSNSIKHAFPENRPGKIRVSMRRIAEPDADSSERHEFIEITVSDDGIGIPEDLDFRNVDSLGLELVVGLSESQLQGKIELNRSGGTEFRIVFKESG
ncbi:MAG: histidine kinase dimerization/phosphoacceptor domain -containing protein [Nitrospirota bacterium]